MKKPFILRSSIVALCAVTLATPSLVAALNDTFDSPGPAATITIVPGGQGLGPTIMQDPSNLANNILHLLNGENSQNNHYTYDQTDPGLFDTITASFDFRVTAGTAGLADGLGFMLIPTANFGVSGDGPSPTAEEPNVPGTFGLGIDVYQNINNVSVHWNNVQVNELNTNYAVDFRNNLVFNNIQVVLQRVGNGTNATVTMINDSLGFFGPPGTPVKVMETVMPNMLPYDHRVHFAARTGGENMNVDVDNVKMDYATPFVNTLPVAPTGHLFQDFDSAGATGYRAVQAATSNGTTFRPGPLIKAAEPGTNGAFLRIANDNVEGQNNRVVFDHAMDGGTSNMGEMLSFDIRFNSTDQPADGLGLLFLRTRDPNSGASNFDNDGIPSSEEPNHPNMLGIGFDVYPNGAPDVAPAVSLHWNGNTLTNAALPAELALGQFHRVQVLREPTASGLNVTVTAIPDVNGVAGAPVTLIDHFFVNGATNYDYRVEMSGRTGGANADHDIDNLVTSQIQRPQLATTQANFSPATGSGWKAFAFGVGAAPEVKNEFGLNGNFLRLTHDAVNGQANAVAFDTQLDGSLTGKTRITADLNFRMNSPSGGPADGMSFMLIPTATFGNTGAGAAATPGFVAEEPNVPGTFGVGLDVYDPVLVPFNEASLHWDGAPALDSNFLPYATNIDPSLIDLDSGAFHHLHLELTQDTLGVLVSLIFTPDIFGIPGSEVTIFDNVLVAGMSLFDYRVELAARTGGLDMNIDIDDLLLQTTAIPEPSSAALLGLGALFLARRRRRS